jgi:hypothetical protein
MAARPVQAADKSRLRVDDYQIDAELLPQNHKLTARAVVKITALEDVAVASFRSTIPSASRSWSTPPASR